MRKNGYTFLCTILTFCLLAFSPLSANTDPGVIANNVSVEYQQILDVGEVAITVSGSFDEFDSQAALPANVINKIVYDFINQTTRATGVYSGTMLYKTVLISRFASDEVGWQSYNNYM